MFIITNTTPRDWLGTNSDDNLWQGMNGVNNPCPNSYRIPTANELNNERLSWATNDPAGAFGSPLKFPLGGTRFSLSGVVYANHVEGLFWTSTVLNIYGRHIVIDNISNSAIIESYRAIANSVRCIKN